MCWHSSTSFFTLMIKKIFQMQHHSVNPLPLICRGVGIFEKSQKGDQDFELSGISMGRYCLKCLAKSRGFGKNIKRGGWSWPYRGGRLSIEGGFKPSAHYETLGLLLFWQPTDPKQFSWLPIQQKIKLPVIYNLETIYYNL